MKILKTYEKFKISKKVSKPSIVRFNTKSELISFKATKKISKPTIITFYTEMTSGK